MNPTLLFLTACIAPCLADAVVTAAAQLAPRADDPAFVGYISRSNGFSDARSCDFPQTVSTSGSYVQCCPTTGACPFFTTCSSNTLIAASATVPCDVDPALTCNTGIVAATAGAPGGPSYLACWQTSLGNSTFTFVQDIGTATAAAPSSTGSGSTGATTPGSSSSASRSSSATLPRATSSSASAASTSSSLAAAAIGLPVNAGTGFVGMVMFIADMLL